MKNPEIVMDLYITRITDMYAKRKNIEQDIALEIVLGSKTCDTLLDKETGLCYEMLEYVYEIFLEEVGEPIDI